MANYKKYGVISKIDEPVVKENFSCQSFLLECETKNGNTIKYPFTVFTDALTTDNMKHVVEGNRVTVSFFINSKEATSMNGNTYYKLTLSVDKIESGNTTDESAPVRAANTNPVFAGYSPAQDSAEPF